MSTFFKMSIEKVEVKHIYVVYEWLLDIFALQIFVMFLTYSSSHFY